MVAGLTDSMDLFSFKDIPDSEKEDLDNGSKSAQSVSMDLFGGQKNTVSVEFGADKEVSGEAEKNSDNVDADRNDLKEAELFFAAKEADSMFSFRDDREPEQGGKVLQGNVSKMTVDENTFEFSDTETDAGYVADSVESVEADQVHSENDENQVAQMILGHPNLASAFADSFKFWALCKKFEHGTLVQALDKQKKPLFLLLQLGEDLMAYKYLGSSLEIEVPATVGKRQVKYLHPHLLSGGVNPFKGVKAQNFKSNFNVENLADLSKESLKVSLQGVKTLLLPEGIKMLPPNLFYHCLVLKEIVVPASVTAVSHNTFAGSGIRDIWFNGACPLGFLESTKLPRGVKVHYRREYANSFGGDV